MSDIDWSAVAAEFLPPARRLLDRIPTFEKIFLSPDGIPEGVVETLAGVAGVPVRVLTKARFYRGVSDHAWADFLAKLPNRDVAGLPEQPEVVCATTAINSIRRLMAYVQKKADESPAGKKPSDGQEEAPPSEDIGRKDKAVPPPKQKQPKKRITSQEANATMMRAIDIHGAGVDEDTAIERMKWSARKWKDYVGCGSTSTIHGTEMWKQFAVARDKNKQERMERNRGRRKPRHRSKA
jgi:hypothetical protein